MLTHFVSVYGWWQRVYSLHSLVDACHASLLVHFARTPAATSHTLARGGPHSSLGAQKAVTNINFIIRDYVDLVTWPKFGLFALIFVYFIVRSPAMHSKISLNQLKNT
jgi:hypothetical protein